MGDCTRTRLEARRLDSCLKNKIRHLVSNYNGDRPDLFAAEGQKYLEELPLSPADRFVVEQLLSSWHHHEEQLQAMG